MMGRREGGRAVGHLVFGGASYWRQRDRRRGKGKTKESTEIVLLVLLF